MPSLHGLRSDPFGARRRGRSPPSSLRWTFSFLLALDPPKADCSSKLRSGTMASIKMWGKSGAFNAFSQKR